jgi:hypothetical protein
MASVADLDLKNLLDTATFLNNRLKIGSYTAHITEEINKTNNSLESKKGDLQNIKDAIETYNREFIERENNMPQKNVFSNIQDWSLFILFAGYIAFSLGVLIYIFRFSRMPIFIGITFMILTSFLMILFVFMIQRYG